MSDSVEFATWSAVLKRCNDPRATGYDKYGGRGITVCAGWTGPEGFARFFAGMGPRPSPVMSIDRKDNDGGYWCGRCEECTRLGREPNCRWASKSEQANNRRSSVTLTHDGATRTIAEWARIAKIDEFVLRARVDKLGWEPARALFTPVRHMTPRKQKTASP